MTRKNLRSKGTPAKHRDGLSNIGNDGPVSLDVIENNESFSKAMNGSLIEPKHLHKDLTDIPLKDRLRIQRKKENGSSSEVAEKVNESMEINADEALAEKASTSKKDFDKTEIMKNVEEAKSLAVLLGQGLTSGDAQKIDAVLSETDVHIIAATLNDLPVTQIVPLLKQIEYRLKNRSSLDIRCWVRWVQYIISMHMAYLSTLGTLEEDLKGLFEWMRSRTSQMGKLCELYGKLALVTEQVERRANPRLFVLQEPMIFFTGDNLSSSEDSEGMEELEGESIASNDDWWDDEEIATDSEQDHGSEDDNDVRKKELYSGDSGTSEDDEEDSVDEAGSSGMEME